MINFTTNSPQETIKLGERIAKKIPLNVVVALSGGLGCGKTTLVKGMAKALGIDSKKVNSPSYVLIKEYHTRAGDLFHLDLYRLQGIKEIAKLGIEEYFNRNGMLIIEWAEKAEALLPGDYLKINIKALSETNRRFTIDSCGGKYNKLLDIFKGGMK